MIITKELLKKRAEHNDGELSSLVEISLHQFDIEKIELLEQLCKNLEILLLQNNQILKIENLGKLKALSYLNLALNNITKLENLGNCESLRKLDLTINFISDVMDVESLKGNQELKELFLVGNPCTQTIGYRDFALDGIEITKTERIKAMQVYDEIRARILAEKATKQTQENKTTTESLATDSRTIEDIKKDFNTKPVPFTPQTRLQTAHDVQKMNSTQEKSQPKKEIYKPILNSKTNLVYQKNEPGLYFNLETFKTYTKFTLYTPLTLDTSLIKVDIQEKYIYILVKNKAVVVNFELEVKIEEEFVRIERCKTMGWLACYCINKGHEENDINEIIAENKKEKREEKSINKIGDSRKKEIEVEKKVFRRIEQVEDFDEEGVPPLC